MQKLAYGVGHVFNDLCGAMWFTYLLIFFTKVIQFSNSLAGTVLLVGQIADALATPFIGYISDRGDNMWLCRFGKRKTWYLLGEFLSCIVQTATELLINISFDFVTVSQESKQMFF